VFGGQGRDVVKSRIVALRERREGGRGKHSEVKTKRGVSSVKKVRESEREEQWYLR